MRLAGAIEEDVYLGIDAFAAASFKVSARVKGQTVNTGGCSWRETAASSVSIRGARRNGDPLSVFALFKHNRDSLRRLAKDCIQHMRRNLAHSISHFPKRSCVICLCCSAASCNSAPRLFASRRLRIPSISSALFPVAQTIYVKPNRCS